MWQEVERAEAVREDVDGLVVDVACTGETGSKVSLG
jgi:hypothetical protein